jgi:hypothetical protein
MTDTVPTGAARTGAGESRDPVFILSPMRSYSTVTVAVLAGHPEIYGFPELLIFSARTIGDILSAKVWSKASGRRLNVRLSGVCRTIAELHEAARSKTPWSVLCGGWPSGPTGRARGFLTTCSALSGRGYRWRNRRTRS